MKISQREAHRLRKDNARLRDVLRDQGRAWSSDWGNGWVHIATIRLDDSTQSAVNTARRLGHAVIVLPDQNGTIRLYADRLEEAK
jgi:hypothetical protein